MNDENNSEIKKFEIIKSKDNNDILVINGKSIHSKFFPLKEAKDIKYPGKNLILIFGLGFAYHVNNLINNNPQSIFIIFEPITDIYKLQAKYLDLDSIKKNNIQIYIINKLDKGNIYDFLMKDNKIYNIRIYTYSNPGYKTLFPENELLFFQSVNKIMKIIVQNIMTESNFIPLWTKNFIYNSSSLFNLPLFNPNNVNLNNNIAVICCAGPTLNCDIDLIKKYKDKITIFTVDTALKTLLKNNIIPDFIVSLDGQHYTIDDFMNIPEHCCLFLDILSYPPVARMFKNIYFTITKTLFKESIIEYFFSNFKLIEFGLDTGGTVSDYTLSLAVKLGFKEIYFSGLDLSFPLLMSHSIGSPFHDRLINFSNYYKTSQTILLNTLSKRRLHEAQSRDNNTVISDFVLQNYAFYLDDFIKIHNNINFYYFPKQGIKINNIKPINLDKLINNKNTNKITLNEIKDKCEMINLNKSDISVFYQKIVDSVYIIAKKIDNILKEYDFNDETRVNEFKLLYDDIVMEFPFFKKFIIMTEIILTGKNINNTNVIWYKHIFHRLLQSIYFIIRTIQKNQKLLDN